MTLMRGTLEMIALAGEGEPALFNDFTKIAIGGKKLSSATVVKRLDELLLLKILQEAATRSKSGRRAVGYIVTERGRKILALAKELYQTMESPNKKQARRA